MYVKTLNRCAQSMSSYSSSGMSSYGPASTSSSDHHSSPSTSPSTSPTFPLFIRTGASTPPPLSHSPTKAACPTSPTLPPPTTPHRPRAGAPARDACPHTDGLGVDDAFEVVGRPETIQLAYGITRKAGQIVVVGVARMGTGVEFSAFALPAETKHITGSWYGQAVADTDFPMLLEHYRKGDLKIEELISHRFTLDQLPEALAALERGEVRRGVILMGEQA